MGFIDSIKNGWNLFVNSFGVIFERPIFLIPLFIAWILIAAVVAYLQFYFPEIESDFLFFLFIFGMIFLITMIICMANIMMLEFMQQIWAIIWFLILLLNAGRDKKKKAPQEPTTEEIAKTLAESRTMMSAWRWLGTKAFEKLVRMYIFMTLPSIAWENKGGTTAFKRSFNVIKKHPFEFMTSYTLTGIASLLIIYEAIVWTISIYLEQMNVGLLYLWHLKWLKNGAKGDLSSVERPDLLDNVYEFKKMGKIPEE